MAKSDLSRRSKELSFMGATTLASAIGPRPLLPQVMNVLRDHPLFKLLAAARRENCPEAYETYLFVWLCRMGVPPPEGVFREPR
jgi:hypothetical protein